MANSLGARLKNIKYSCFRKIIATDELNIVERGKEYVAESTLRENVFHSYTWQK